MIKKKTFVKSATLENWNRWNVFVKKRPSIYSSFRWKFRSIWRGWTHSLRVATIRSRGTRDSGRTVRFPRGTTNRQCPGVIDHLGKRCLIVPIKAVNLRYRFRFLFVFSLVWTRLIIRRPVVQRAQSKKSKVKYRVVIFWNPEVKRITSLIQHDIITHDAIWRVHATCSRDFSIQCSFYMSR